MNWRKLIITVAALVALGGATANTAQARLKICSANMNVKSELQCGKQLLHYHSCAARWIRNHALRAPVSTQLDVTKIWRSRLEFHLWMMRRSRRWIKEANHRLARITTQVVQPSYSGGIHLGFWNCVHGREGNSHPSTNHPYSGPLQMTSYWAGYNVYDWSTVPVSVVYADAEQQLQKHIRIGDVYTWVAGQWPNTSGPCLGYLN